METEEIKTESTALVAVINESGLENETALAIKSRFVQFFEQTEEWRKKAETMVVTDVSQTSEMKMCRVARLALKDIRVNADKTRKELKEDSLRYGKAVQAVYNAIEGLIAPIEKHLETQEKFAELQEAKRKADLKAKRLAQLQPYLEFVEPHFMMLESMSDEAFENIISGAKLQLQAKIDSEAKAELERVESERLDKVEAARRIEVAKYANYMKHETEGTIDLRNAPEDRYQAVLERLKFAEKIHLDNQEQIRLENERLKKEAEDKELEIQKEREAADKLLADEKAKADLERKEMEAQLQKERDAKAQLEREQKQKADAELKKQQEAAAAEKQRLADEAKAEKKAASAPDKAKLLALAEHFKLVELPTLKTKEAHDILGNIKTLVNKLATYIQEQAANL